MASSDFYCKITRFIFFDPVTASDGFTYERDALDNWLSKSKTSPVTNERLVFFSSGQKFYIKNITLANIIKEFLEKNPQFKEEQYVKMLLDFDKTSCNDLIKNKKFNSLLDYKNFIYEDIDFTTIYKECKNIKIINYVADNCNFDFDQSSNVLCSLANDINITFLLSALQKITNFNPKKSLILSLINSKLNKKNFDTVLKILIEKGANIKISNKIKIRKFNKFNKNDKDDKNDSSNFFNLIYPKVSNEYFFKLIEIYGLKDLCDIKLLFNLTFEDQNFKLMTLLINDIDINSIDNEGVPYLFILMRLSSNDECHQLLLSIFDKILVNRIYGNVRLCQIILRHANAKLIDLTLDKIVLINETVSQINYLNCIRRGIISISEKEISDSIEFSSDTHSETTIAVPTDVRDVSPTDSETEFESESEYEMNHHNNRKPITLLELIFFNDSISGDEKEKLAIKFLKLKNL